MKANDVTLAAKVRRRVDSGELPREYPPKVRSALGNGKTCSACDQTIYPAQLMYELDWGATETTYRLHSGCYGLWTADLIRRRLYKRE